MGILMNSQNEYDDRKKEIIKKLSDEEKMILKHVLELEQSYIHLESPRGIKEDLLKIIQETVK